MAKHGANTHHKATPAGALIIRLRDIAQHLSLSESTVSRVLNGKGSVGAETRAAILKYAADTDYHPNRLALSLKKQQSKTIGVLLPDINNVFYSEMFKTIDVNLRRAGFTSILFDTNEEMHREESFLNYLQSSVVDGMIVATSGSTAYGQLPQRLLTRIVFVDNRPKLDARVAFVGTDNMSSARLLTEHLIQRGHRRIATLVGSLSESSARERLQGFEECAKAHGLDVPPGWVARTTFRYKDGYATSRRLLTAKNRPTAIIAQNNVLAYATVRVAQELGLSVPGDLAVACFDHVDVYGFMRPVITTVVQPITDIAALASQTLLAAISDESYEPPDVSLPAEFRLGETTSGPPQDANTVPAVGHSA